MNFKMQTQDNGPKRTKEYFFFDETNKWMNSAAFVVYAAVDGTYSVVAQGKCPALKDETNFKEAVEAGIAAWKAFLSELDDPYEGGQ